MSTSGLTSDGPTPSPPDAAESAAPDAPPPAVDGGKDAPVDVDAGPPSPCKGTPAFCDDFDRTNAVHSGWTNFSLSDGAGVALSIVGDRAVSSPSALLTKLPRREASGPAQCAVLDKTVGGSCSRAAVSWDMYVVRPTFVSGDINVGVGCFSGRAGNVRGSGCMSIGPDYVSALGATLAQLAWDRWVHFEVTMPADAVPQIRVDKGETVTGAYEIEASAGDPEVRIALGLHGYNKPAPAFTVYYDNFVVDVTK